MKREHHSAFNALRLSLKLVFHDTTWRQDGILVSWNYCWRLTKQQCEAAQATALLHETVNVLTTFNDVLEESQTGCFIEITTVRHVVAVSEVLACIVIKRTKIFQCRAITEGILVLKKHRYQTHFSSPASVFNNNYNNDNNNEHICTA